MKAMNVVGISTVLAHQVFVKMTLRSILIKRVVIKLPAPIAGASGGGDAEMDTLFIFSGGGAGGHHHHSVH